MVFRNSVPCGTCQLCCKMMTPLTEEEHENYDWGRWIENGVDRGYVLWRKPNGDCIYLNENGCSIHDRAPKVCREFDCRATFLSHDRRARRLAIKHKEITREIFERGRELLEQEKKCG